MRDAHIHITGIVQGVGFRPFVYREAVARGIAGWVLNAGDGVHIEAHAPSDDALDAFVEALRACAPEAAHISSVEVTPLAQACAPSASSTSTTFPSPTAPEEPGASNARSDAPRKHATVGFRIVASDGATARTTLVSPDIATCPDCLRELFDPTDRRYHYPFINCTNCGPRFTIIRALPYDRPNTSMDAFPMCPDCAAEYADPANRRFHAQPNACFACGPHLTWREHARPTSAAGAGDPREDADDEESAVPIVGRTRERSDAIIARCTELIARGGIVAIKGLGGFHLVCDAACEPAVQELRRRKRRSNKPLAIMVRTVEDARRFCHVSDAERELLTGSVRPIVLLQRRNTAARKPAAEHGPDALAPSVAHDLPELGVMLPYTPLQHLLLAACAAQGVTALIMTSGNLSEEPIETDDRLAWERLVETGIADALLGNDRAILARFDDSVVRFVAGAIRPVRRARGYAPSPLALPQLAGISGAACAVDARDAVETAHDGLPPTILACGAEQKATLALTREVPNGTAACFLSQHIGDVETGTTLDTWHETAHRLMRLFELEPHALACDLHPSYLTAQWARNEAERRRIPLVEVQHHHAHIAATISEAAARGEVDPNERVIGIALDGTGAGTDGTVWGGELLVASLAGFARVGHLAPWRLPGGAAAVRDARRNAYALLKACSLLDHPAAAPMLEELSATERTLLDTMISRGLNSPHTSSMGRFLDALAALLGICEQATYEGEPACELEAAAWRSSDGQAAKREGSDMQEDRYRCSMAWEVAPAPDAATTAAQRRVAEHAVREQLVLGPASLVCAALDDVSAGHSRNDIARRVHRGVARSLFEAVCALHERTGIDTVALGGGVFLNRLLLEALQRLLEANGFTVLIPRDIPVNDGGIAYGQAAVARARLAAPAN